jgi:hypothetical protein
MKYILFSLFMLLFAACQEEPHLKHKLSFTKYNEECLGGEFPLKLTSNTNGERYEFKQCLPQEFEGKYNLTRVADTLVVQFPDTLVTSNAFFNLVLDVDAFPKYGHIRLGEQLIKVGTTK